MRSLLNPSFKATVFDLGFGEIRPETGGSEWPIWNHANLTYNWSTLTNMMYLSMNMMSLGLSHYGLHGGPCNWGTT